MSGRLLVLVAIDICTVCRQNLMIFSHKSRLLEMRCSQVPWCALAYLFRRLGISRIHDRNLPYRRDAWFGSRCKPSTTGNSQRFSNHSPCRLASSAHSRWSYAGSTCWIRRRRSLFSRVTRCSSAFRPSLFRDLKFWYWGSRWLSSELLRMMNDIFSSNKRLSFSMFANRSSWGVHNANYRMEMKRIVLLDWNRETWKVRRVGTVTHH